MLRSVMGMHAGPPANVSLDPSAQTACIQDGSEDEVAVGAWPRRRISLEARVTYKGLPWAAAQVARLCQTGYLLP